MRVWAIALFGLILMTPAARAQTMYARFSAPVRGGRTLSAETLGELKQGEAVEVTGREGSYYRVRYRGRQGYVYYNKLTDEKPQDVAALLGQAPAGRGVELRELEAGGALRGLSPMAENYVKASEAPEWAVQAVEGMQSRQVGLQRLEDFQREGGLGEYGEAER